MGDGSGRDAKLTDLAELLLSDADTVRYQDLMARAVTAAIIGAASASVTLCDETGTLTVAAAGESARRLHQAQVSASRGPCLAALRAGREVLLDPLPSGRWPEFTAAARREGIGSSLSVPVASAGHRGVVSINGERAGLFCRPAVLAEARQAVRYFAAILSASYRYAHAAGQCAQLRRALESRAVIEQAKGMIMVQVGCSADEAFAVLARASRRQHLRLRDIASSVVAAGLSPAAGPGDRFEAVPAGQGAAAASGRASPVTGARARGTDHGA